MFLVCPDVLYTGQREHLPYPTLLAPVTHPERSEMQQRGLTLAMTRSSARRVSLSLGNVDGSKYWGAYSSSHSGRTSVTVRMNCVISMETTF